MNPLEVKMNKRDIALKKKAEMSGTPVFRSDGKYQKAKKEVPKKAIVAISIVAIVLGIIYIPGFFMKDKIENDFVIKPDVVGIKNVSEAAKNDPDGDFDNDGLINSIEVKYGTSQRNFDTDRDGICDYAELFITNTNPLVAEKTLINVVEKYNNDKNQKATSPVKLNEVIMWADNIESNAYGSVVRTQTGYRFYKFKGWAQFPVGKYAYKIENGKHILLEHRETENAWRIDTECEIVLSDEPLEMVHQFSVLGIGKFYIPDNIFGKILTAILPSKGIITCEKIAKIDTWQNSDDIVTADIVNIKYDKDNLSRYGKNNNSLEDLANVYDSIKNNSSVLVSLNSQEYGEVIAEIYGFTKDGKLLVADPTTLKPIGSIQIIEKSCRYMNDKGELDYKEWFEFVGIGFNSFENGDRINFFAAAVNNSAFYEEPVTKPSTVQEGPTTNNINELPSEIEMSENQSTYETETNEYEGTTAEQMTAG